MKKIVSDCGNWKVYGSENPKFMLAGHSHTFSMFLAIQKNSEVSKNFAVITQADFNNQKIVDESYWEFTKSISKNYLTCISWNGNQHNLNFLLDNNQDFSAIGYNEESGFPAVSLDRIYELYADTFLDLERVLLSLKNKSNLVLLGTPAPKSKIFIDKRLSEDKNLVDLIQTENRSLSKVQASSDKLRSFMWKINQDLLSDIAAKNQIRLLETPKDSYDENLILFSKYYTDDLTHANLEYGEMMLDMISRKLVN